MHFEEKDNNLKPKASLIVMKEDLSVSSHSILKVGDEELPHVKKLDEDYGEVESGGKGIITKAKTNVDGGLNKPKKSIFVEDRRQMKVENKNELDDSISFHKMDYFDKIAHFKSYFPAFNFSEIRSKMLFNHQIQKKRKREEIKRLSQYCFRYLNLYELVKKKRCNKRDVSFSTEKSPNWSLTPSNLSPSLYQEKENSKRRKFTLTDLVSQIIRIQKDKKEKGKWNFKLGQILRKIVSLFSIKK